MRPSSIYQARIHPTIQHSNKGLQVIVSLLEEAESMRVKASLSRDGVEVHGADTVLDPLQSRPVLLQVPPGYNVANQYKLRIEGYSRHGGAIIFTNETALQFSDKFLSITISTNKVVFTAIHTIKVTITSHFSLF